MTTLVLQHIQITQQQEDDHCCVFCTKALNYSPPSKHHKLNRDLLFSAVKDDIPIK